MRRGGEDQGGRGDGREGERGREGHTPPLVYFECWCYPLDGWGHGELVHANDVPIDNISTSIKLKSEEYGRRKEEGGRIRKMVLSPFFWPSFSLSLVPLAPFNSLLLSPLSMWSDVTVLPQAVEERRDIRRERIGEVKGIKIHKKKRKAKRSNAHRLRLGRPS